MEGIIVFALLAVAAVNAAILEKRNELPRHLREPEDSNDKQLVVPQIDEGYAVAYIVYSYLRRIVDNPYQLDAIVADPNAIREIFAGRWTPQQMNAMVDLLNKYPLSVLQNNAIQSRGIISGLSNLSNLLSSLLGLASSTAENTATAVETVVQNFFASAFAVGGMAVEAAAQQLLKFLEPFKNVLGGVYNLVVNAVNNVLGRPAVLEI